MAVAFLAMAQAAGQEPTTPTPKKTLRKLKIRSADPQLIYLLLSGKVNFNHGPEISSKGG